MQTMPFTNPSPIMPRPKLLLLLNLHSHPNFLSSSSPSSQIFHQSLSLSLSYPSFDPHPSSISNASYFVTNLNPISFHSPLQSFPFDHTSTPLNDPYPCPTCPLIHRISGPKIRSSAWTWCTTRCLEAVKTPPNQTHPPPPLLLLQSWLCILT
jgi:hypothetical protein